MTENNDNNAEAKADTQAPSRAFIMIKTYVKDVSFEAPNTPAIFATLKKTPVSPPELKINGNARQINENAFEYTLSLELIAKIEEEIAYLAEIHQSGIFQIIGHSTEELNTVDFVDRCPKELFPFAREALHNLIDKGGFGQELLGSINFASLFAERQVAVDNQVNDLVKKQLLGEND